MNKSQLGLIKLFLIGFALSSLTSLNAHQLDRKHVGQILQSEARYLGNEGVMVSHVLDNRKVEVLTHTSSDNRDRIKILFDPFFKSSFGIYTLVPDSIKQAIEKGSPPYDNIDLVFVSHAHADHFDADSLVKFLKRNPNAKVVAPSQAISAIVANKLGAEISKQLVEVKLKVGDKPLMFEFDGVNVNAFRIPHAGWPQRANIENIVYRVTLGDKKYNPITVMHMGDADPNEAHFITQKAAWQAIETDLAMPPYWFFLSKQGLNILDHHINARRHVGIHVETQVPPALKDTGKDYFSIPAEVRWFDEDISKTSSRD